MATGVLRKDGARLPLWAAVLVQLSFLRPTHGAWQMPSMEGVKKATTTACVPCSTRTPPPMTTPPPHTGTTATTPHAVLTTTPAVHTSLSTQQKAVLSVASETPQSVGASSPKEMVPKVASESPQSDDVFSQTETVPKATQVMSDDFSKRPKKGLLEYMAPLDALPHGYKLGAEAVSLVDKTDLHSSQYVRKGEVCKMWYPNNDDIHHKLAFYLSCPTWATVNMGVNEFAMKPINSKCGGMPDYSQVKSHAVCFSMKGGAYEWHDPWTASQAIPAAGGCSAVKIDCGDSDRITRILHKYSWVSEQTGNLGPEMKRVDFNTYTDCCVRSQCLGGPAQDCGAVPLVKAEQGKFAAADLPEAKPLRTVLASLLCVATVVFVISGMVFASSRVDAERTQAMCIEPNLNELQVELDTEADIDTFSLCLVSELPKSGMGGCQPSQPFGDDNEVGINFLEIGEGKLVDLDASGYQRVGLQSEFPSSIDEDTEFQELSPMFHSPTAQASLPHVCVPHQSEGAARWHHPSGE